MSKITSAVRDEDLADGPARVYSVSCQHGGLERVVPKDAVTTALADEAIFLSMVKPHRQRFGCACAIGLWGRYGQRYQRRGKGAADDDEDDDDDA